MNRRTRKLVRLSFFLAASVLLNYIEAVLLQFPSIAPGVKLGLANCVGLVVLYFYGPVDFFSVGFLRVLLVALLRTGFGSAFFISMGGFLVSSLAVIIVYKISKASIYGLSTVSALFHSIGQIFIVSCLYNSIYMINYLPILAYSSLISGVLVAMVAAEVLIRIRIEEDY